MPFAGYKNFASCVRANKDKKNPQAYCASIMHAIEGKVELDSKIHAYGQTNQRGDIKVNPKKGDVVNTVIHEELHAADWNMEHDKVYKTAAKIESQMSLPEMAQVLLDTHERSMNKTKPREYIHTTASKVVKSNIK